MYDSSAGYAGTIRKWPGFQSWIEECHMELAPGVYSFSLFLDPPPDSVLWSGAQSLLLDLSLWLSPAEERVAAVEQEKVELSSFSSASAQFTCRLVIPVGQAGDFRATYRTESTTLTYARHSFVRHGGPTPRTVASSEAGGAAPGETPVTVDAGGIVEAPLKRDVSVLVMDGGGVRGIAELMILQSILNRVQAIRRDADAEAIALQQQQVAAGDPRPFGGRPNAKGERAAAD